MPNLIPERAENLFSGCAGNVSSRHSKQWHDETFGDCVALLLAMS